MSKHCPKCQHSMTVGLVLDHKDGGRRVSSWLEGAPVRSMLMGLKLGRKPIEIQTWRCTRCGFLESYAPH